MAQSTSDNARKTWKGVLIGAAVPIAMLAGAPAASAQPLPAEPPDVQALIDLELCLADLQAALAVEVPAEPPVAEQGLPGEIPGLPTDAPDVAAMNATCQTVLALVLAQTPDVPADPPLEPPVEPPLEPPADPPVDLPGPVQPAG